MLTSRDKLLAGLFAVQLTAAAAFGAVLVHGLHHETQGTATLAAAPGSAAAGGSAPLAAATTGAPVATGSPSPGTSASAAAATGPHTVTTIVGGSAGSAGSSGVPVPGSTAAGTSTGKKAAGSGTKAGASAAATAAAASASAAAPAGTSEIAPGAPIKIGSIVTQSGAINFKSSAQGTKAYIDMVNAAGGIAGHQIQLIQDDDQLNASTGASQFEDLAQQGIFTYGAFSAPQTEGGLQQQLDAQGIPLIGSYGEYPEYHDQLAFAFSADYIHYGFQMGQYLKKLGVTKPALMFVTNNNDAANNQIINGFTTGFGAAPTYTQITQPTDTYQSYVLQMRSMGVDGLASILDTGSYERFLQAAGSYATQLKHVADALFDSPAIKSISNADGTYVASDFAFADSTDPVVAAYANAVTAEFGSSAIVDYFGEQGWLDGIILVDALKSMNGVFTRTGLVKAVEALPGNLDNGLTHDLTFGTGNRDMNKCIQFGKLTGGKVVQTQDYTCDTQAA